ncbi:hypothetical protein BKA56DRAFT_309398 [Ilyonectria sp. MPI-CAGE-AT-0026]|nr:hypothetical protein BKA56DRAFT_309398 [Ilyonectria sp. MPI-CAGE-AT-0026]
MAAMDRVSRHPLVGIELGTSMMVTISRIALKILPCVLSNANWRDAQSSKPPSAWLQRVHLATLASDILAGILADPPHFSAGIKIKKKHPPPCLGLSGHRILSQRKSHGSRNPFRSSLFPPHPLTVQSAASPKKRPHGRSKITVIILTCRRRRRRRRMAIGSLGAGVPYTDVFDRLTHALCSQPRRAVCHGGALCTTALPVTAASSTPTSSS